MFAFKKSSIIFFIRMNTVTKIDGIVFFSTFVSFRTLLWWTFILLKINTFFRENIDIYTTTSIFRTLPARIFIWNEKYATVLTKFGIFTYIFIRSLTIALSTYIVFQNIFTPKRFTT